MSSSPEEAPAPRAYLFVGPVHPDEHERDTIDPEFYVARCAQPPSDPTMKIVDVEAPVAAYQKNRAIPAEYGDGVVYDHLDRSLRFTSEAALCAAQDAHGRPGQQAFFDWEMLDESLQESERIAEQGPDTD